MGALFVDITTDKTGAAARVDFLNKVPVEIQEYVRKKVMGRHFGVPNHCYRRHVEYKLFEAN